MVIRIDLSRYICYVPVSSLQLSLRDTVMKLSFLKKHQILFSSIFIILLFFKLTHAAANDSNEGLSNDDIKRLLESPTRENVKTLVEFLDGLSDKDFEAWMIFFKQGMPSIYEKLPLSIVGRAITVVNPNKTIKDVVKSLPPSILEYDFSGLPEEDRKLVTLPPVFVPVHLDPTTFVFPPNLDSDIDSNEKVLFDPITGLERTEFPIEGDVVPQKFEFPAQRPFEPGNRMLCEPLGYKNPSFLAYPECFTAIYPDALAVSQDNISSSIGGNIKNILVPMAICGMGVCAIVELISGASASPVAIPVFTALASFVGISIFDEDTELNEKGKQDFTVNDGHQTYNFKCKIRNEDVYCYLVNG